MLGETRAYFTKKLFVHPLCRYSSSFLLTMNSDEPIKHFVIQYVCVENNYLLGQCHRFINGVLIIVYLWIVRFIWFLRNFVRQYLPCVNIKWPVATRPFFYYTQVNLCWIQRTARGVRCACGHAFQDTGKYNLAICEIVREIWGRCYQLCSPLSSV